MSERSRTPSCDLFILEEISISNTLGDYFGRHFDPGTLTVKLPEFELQDSAADMVISLRIRCCSTDRLECSLSDQYRTGTVKLI